MIFQWYFFMLIISFTWAQPHHRAEAGNKPQIFGEGKDYYPLGILGAKGWPENNGFRIQLLEKEGLAEKAGLQIEDIIVSIQDRSFAPDESWKVLGNVIEQSECTSSATTFVLKIKRNTETLSISLTYTPKTFHGETCPYVCSACQSLVKDALKILAKMQHKEGSLPTEMAATNGICVVSSLALMAFIASGETGKSGLYTENIQNLLTFLSKNTGKDPIDQLMRKSGVKENWNQSNWAWAFSGISANLLHKNRNHPKAKSLAEKASSTLIKNQKKETGGWGHGPGGKNALGYNEFWMITGLALLELGLTQQNEIKVSSKTIDLALSYLNQCVSPQGGIGYSALNKWGGDTARTAVALLALVALNRKEEPLFTALSEWFLAHLESLESAHQGYLLQLVLTGLAARELGENAFKKFWKRYRHEILMARVLHRPGYFSTRPTLESLQNRANNDIALGEFWTISAYAILLQLADGKLPFICSEKK